MLHAQPDAPKTRYTISKLSHPFNRELEVFISLAIENLHGMRQVTDLYCSSHIPPFLASLMGRQNRVVPIIPQQHTSDQAIS